MSDSLIYYAPGHRPSAEQKGRRKVIGCLLVGRFRIAQLSSVLRNHAAVATDKPGRCRLVLANVPSAGCRYAADAAYRGFVARAAEVSRRFGNLAAGCTYMIHVPPPLLLIKVVINYAHDPYGVKVQRRKPGLSFACRPNRLDWAGLSLYPETGCGCVSSQRLRMLYFPSAVFEKGHD